MSGRRVRGFLILAALLALGWWIYEERPTVSGLVDDLTRPIFGSRAAVRQSEYKRVVSDASRVIAVGEEKALGAIHEGMSEWEVRRLLGDPDSIERMVDERGERFRWTYRGVNRVVLIHRNRVVSIAVR